MFGSYVNALPSRFLDELPPENIERENAMAMAQHGRSNHWDSSGFQGYTAYSKPIQTRQSAHKPQQSRTENGDILARNDRVFHTKFGYGTIVNIEGHKLDIKFETSGLKRVMDSFVEKQ